MRFNEKDLIALSQKEGDLTGRLSYTQYKGALGSKRDAGMDAELTKLLILTLQSRLMLFGLVLVADAGKFLTD